MTRRDVITAAVLPITVGCVVLPGAAGVAAGPSLIELTPEQRRLLRSLRTRTHKALLVFELTSDDAELYRINCEARDEAYGVCEGLQGDLWARSKDGFTALRASAMDRQPMALESLASYDRAREAVVALTDTLGAKYSPGADWYCGRIEDGWIMFHPKNDQMELGPGPLSKSHALLSRNVWNEEISARP
jgi:hypothetical protein